MAHNHNADRVARGGLLGCRMSFFQSEHHLKNPFHIHAKRPTEVYPSSPASEPASEYSIELVRCSAAAAAC